MTAAGIAVLEEGRVPERVAAAVLAAVDAGKQVGLTATGDSGLHGRPRWTIMCRATESSAAVGDSVAPEKGVGI